MKKNSTYIRNRLSLRKPQTDSLEILSILSDKLTLKKNSNIEEELKLVNGLYPICTSFERDFPSLCFALATGVGKTRLMGAFISYLYLEKGIKNFFVLSPNLTVYNKLIEDFSNIRSPKYVFQGISEFVHSRPYIVTGDNYSQLSTTELFESSIHINIFNISKINSETRGGKQPKIKRLSEYLGESYFDYLTNLDDLILLMDESHHYRADRGMLVINELKPVLGLELTATPQIERGNQQPVKFKNVVYEYSLSKAITDGFVKDPSVATRKDFNPEQFSPEDLDRIKLEDGVRIHEDTKVALDIYSRDNKVRRVKPFVLVVAKDTDHAGILKNLIVSNSFFDGYYADKVMEIHSSQTGEEKEENIERLVQLENDDNKIEIVIHVNMLKEGWDVRNLYTIIPLRTAASTTLREQTIGRGLRLPYGIKTGNSKVDKLTIVAHDRFQEIIDEANKPGSIIKRENIIEIDPSEYAGKKEVISSYTTLQSEINEQQKNINKIEFQPEKEKAQVNLDIKIAIVSAIPEFNKEIKNINDLTKKDIKGIVIENASKKLLGKPQYHMFSEQIITEIEKEYDVIVADYTSKIIEIPRIIIQQSDEVKAGFNDFELDSRSLNYQPTTEEILIVSLSSGKYEVIEPSGRKIVYDSLENILVNELINYSEIDYDEHKDLLFKLCGQAIDKLRSYLDNNKIMNVVQFHKRDIGKFIHSQMMSNFYFEEKSYQVPIVYPFDRITEHNYSKEIRDTIYDFKETVTPTNSIPQKVFSGFKKACHNLYKFDSKTEKDFSIILENDPKVLKWLRPALGQFRIYWDHNSRQYNPDFIAETENTIYMIETKKESDISTTEVQEKSLSALQYCNFATEFTTVNKGKPWKYVLIPHNAVLLNMSFENLVKAYHFKI